MEDNQVTVTPAAIVCVLGAAASLLILASIGSHLTAVFTGYEVYPVNDPGTQVDDFVRFLSVDMEKNLPTFFSTSLLILAALLLSVITVFERRRSNSYAFYWAILSCGFFVMAGDELLQFHERLITPGRELLGDDYSGIFHFAWVVPGIVLVVVLAVFFRRFLSSLERTTRLAFLTAAILYVGGAIGLELLGGYVATSQGQTYSVLYASITTVEEGLEMAGTIVFIWALLMHISQLQRTSRVL